MPARPGELEQCVERVPGVTDPPDVGSAYGAGLEDAARRALHASPGLSVEVPGSGPWMESSRRPEHPDVRLADSGDAGEAGAGLPGGARGGLPGGAILATHRAD